MTRPLTLAVSLGCPGGIGPEIALAATSARSAELGRILLFGDATLLRARAGSVGVDAGRIVVVATPEEAHRLPSDRIAVFEGATRLEESDRVPGRFSPRGGAAQLAWIDAATDAVIAGIADALVTGPASKAAVASASPSSAAARAFRGHTEHLGARLGASGEEGKPCDTVMAFVAEKLVITLATTHLPLGEVAKVLGPADVARAAYWTARLVDDLELAPDKAVAILALNPHAGEGGLLGDEETRVEAPGIEQARARLLAEGRMRGLVGPLPAESAIRRCVHEGAYAACVAMYHDQATIPSKLVAFGDAVNVTLGLPIVRTSVDHGTAYDLAGKGTADVRGMEAALSLAARLVRRREKDGDARS